MRWLSRWRVAGATTMVTGASSGIGFELCKLLVARGAFVIATARRTERLQQLQQQVSDPRRLQFIAGDIADAEVRLRLRDSVIEHCQGRLDLLVNNAGVGAIGPFMNAQPERLRRVMEVNFFAPVELSRLLFPMLCRGRHPVLCNISSVLGHRAVPDKSEYCASKFALHGWSDSIRAEWKPSGIQVTLISPSTTASEFFESVIDTDDDQSSKSYGSWSPNRVARAILATVMARRSEAILSLGGKALVYADRLTPPMVNLILAKK
ncbi:MAG: SDR family NAD(P)-dependent oxidoreductase [Planctomycetaceae bacterium]